MSEAKVLLETALRCAAEGRWDEAEQQLEQLRLTGEREDAVEHNLGAIAFTRGQFETAVLKYQRTLELNPRYAQAHANLASALLRLKRYEEATAACHAALALNPRDAKAYYNLGLSLHGQGQDELALDARFKAFQLKPGDAENISFVGQALVNLGRVEEAMPWLDRACAMAPHDLELRFGRCAALLLSGDLPRGFQDYELRWHVGSAKGLLVEHPQPRWLGQCDIRGKTLLMQTEQGLGDTIQFARYAPILAAHGVKVVLQVRPELTALFEGFPGVHALVQRGDPLPPFDFYTPMLSLPLAVRTTLETIPSTPKYLNAPPAYLQKWRDRLGAARKRRVGMVWSGNARHANDRMRSLGLASFPVPHPQLFEVFALQKLVSAEDRRVLGQLGVAVLADELDNLADTAAAIELMDLVITVDTSIAHLAGALGKPVWMLLSVRADWRWLHGRDTSPWYPTMRIFQQRKSGDWRDVFDDVTAALDVMLRNPQAGAGAALP